MADRYDAHMPATHDEYYLTPYRRAQRTTGTDFDVTLWANPRSQQRRFAVMERMVMLAGRRILDAGCSRGDFAQYLIERNVAYARFIGIDGLAEVIDFARTRGLRDAEFHCGDFVSDPSLLRTGDPQVIAISGSLNTMQDDLAMQVLENAWQATQEVLIFNFLSDRAHAAAPPQQDPARRLNTMRLLDWALDRTWAVQLRHDYFRDGHDATIMMRKA